MIILGIDPGIAILGYGIIRTDSRGKLTAGYGTIRTPANQS